ncbi:hypothetical protein IQ250_07500 [Pseudanabaenaceae cyanobacterium LEGE 13415]|nr:hypothetical protein [Pseudanabaenaceae cyanobacterium LEGE 13415]
MGIIAGSSIVVLTQVSTIVPTQPTPTYEVWRYSQFINHVEQRNIRKVTLSADRTRALAETKDGRQILVNLPNDPELIKILTRYQVNISIAPEMQLPKQETTWRYSEFVQQIEQRNVRKVGLNVDRTRALVETVDGKRIWVNLPNDPNLIEILVKHDIDIYVMPESNP